MFIKFIIALTLICISYCNDKIGFVFEVVRHGARSQTDKAKWNDVRQTFNSGYGILSPEGARQRYLLGTHNRNRYIHDYALLD